MFITKPFLKRVATKSVIDFWNKVPAVSGRFVVLEISWEPSGHIPLTIVSFELNNNLLKS